MPKKSGKLRGLQKIMSPLDVVLDTLRQLSSLKQKSSKNQRSFSQKRLQILPFQKRKKKLVFHKKFKLSFPKPPRLPQSYPRKEELHMKPKHLSVQKSTKYEAFRHCLLITKICSHVSARKKSRSCNVTSCEAVIIEQFSGARNYPHPISRMSILVRSIGRM